MITVNISEEKASYFIEALKGAHNCYKDDLDGYAVHCFDYYEASPLKELAELLGADTSAVDEYGDKEWVDESE